MRPENARLVRQSFDYFSPCATAMVARIIRGLADRHPQIRAILPDDPEPVCKAWVATLRQVIRHPGGFRALQAPLGELGRRAAALGTRPQDYAAVREEVLSVMGEYAGDEWTPRLRESWALLLEAMSGAMLAGAVSSAAA